MRALSWIDATEAPPMTIEHGQLEVCAFTHPSPDHADRNEDAAGIWLQDDGSAVLAVADGLGGMPRGAEAAASAIRSIDDSLRGLSPGNAYRPAILDAFEQANSTLLSSIAGSGTTLVIAELSDGHARTYNVGDSAALIVGQRGRVKLETIAHSPVGYGVAAGMIDADSALEHEDRHYLSNHLGARTMHVEVGTARPFAARDTLLLASDGLLDNVAHTEIVEIVRCGPLRDAAQRLAELSASRMAGGDPNVEGKPDDVTFLLLRRCAQ